MLEQHFKRWCLGVFSVTLLLHFSPVDNYLDNDDAWNYVLEAERMLAGQGSAWVEGGNYWVHQNLFRLLASVSWIVRYAIFDLWMPAWHFPSIFFHALNALLLILLLRKLGASEVTSVFAGALFGVSPLHAHTVAWIGGTFDIFCGAFVLGTLLSFINQKTRLGLLCCAGAIMSKEMGVLVGPFLFLYILFYEREKGVSNAVKRLWPYAAVSAVLVGLRLAQINALGSIDQAGLPARTIGFDAYALFVDNPMALMHAVAAPVRALAPVGPIVFAGIAGGILLVALALRGGFKHRSVLLALTSGCLFLIPIFLLKEMGQPMTLVELLHHPRYLYLPQMASALLLPAALIGITAKPTRSVIGVAVVLTCFTLVITGRSVVAMTQPNPAVRVVADTLLAQPPKQGARVYILCNVHDEALLRLLASRWLQEKTQATYHLVQRGSWRVLERDPKRTDGLDFKDFYVRVSPQLFTPADIKPERGDRAYLLQHGGPSGAHSLTAINLKPGAVANNEKQLDITWKQRPPEIHIGTQKAADGQGFNLYRRTDDPQGFQHRAFLISQELRLSAPRIHAFKIRYTAPRISILPHDRLYAWGYFELHWRTDKGTADTNFVSFPLIADGQAHTATVTMDFDPVWRQANNIEWLGVTPLDTEGELVLHSITAVYKP